MKLAKRMAVWTLLSLALQLLVLAAVDRIYLPGRSHIKIYDYLEAVEPAKDFYIQVPSDGEGWSASYSGKYVAFYRQGALWVQDTGKEGGERKICTAEREQLLYQWLPDRNILLYAWKTGGTEPRIKTETMELDSGLHTPLPDIVLQDGRAKLQEIHASSGTNHIYIRVQWAGESRLFRYDILNELKEVGNIPAGAAMLQFALTDGILWQSEETHDVYVMSDDETSKPVEGIGDNWNMTYIDGRDEVYFIVEDAQGNATGVIAGKLKDRVFHTDNVWEIPGDAGTAAFWFTRRGECHYSGMEGELIHVPSGHRREIAGNPFQVNDTCIVSYKGSRLYFTFF